MVGVRLDQEHRQRRQMGSRRDVQRVRPGAEYAGGASFSSMHGAFWIAAGTRVASAGASTTYGFFAKSMVLPATGALQGEQCFVRTYDASMTDRHRDGNDDDDFAYRRRGERTEGLHEIRRSSESGTHAARAAWLTVAVRKQCVIGDVARLSLGQRDRGDRRRRARRSNQRADRRTADEQRLKFSVNLARTKLRAEIGSIRYAAVTCDTSAMDDRHHVAELKSATFGGGARNRRTEHVVAALDAGGIENVGESMH
jgi:hypothetical protein